MKKIFFVLLLSGCWSIPLSHKEVLKQEHQKCENYCVNYSYPQHELYSCDFKEEHCGCTCKKN